MSDNTIYGKIVEYLKKSIEDGSLKIGDAVYSENLLCEKFNVSRTSVRKAIRQMVGENLLVSRQGLGTFVKSNGHGFLHNSICMVNHYSRLLRYDPTDTYYMDAIYGVENAVNLKSLNFQMFSGYIDGELDVKTKMEHIKVDGLIIDGKYLNTGNADYFRRLSPHIVILDGNPEESSFPVIAPDATPAFSELLAMAEYRGGKIIYLYDDFNAICRHRLKCFKAAAQTRNDVVFVNYGESLTRDNFDNIDHYYLIKTALDKAIRSNPECRTVIANSDLSAIKAMHALKQSNFIVPDDIAVSGFSGMNISTMSDPLLTTVYVDAKGMAEIASTHLFAQIEGKHQEIPTLYPTRVLRRKSL